MRTSLITACAIAAPVAAMEPELSLPIDCTVGESCYIQHYVDNDPTDGVSDFACGTTTYDTHKGVDFALPSIMAMQQGVDVLAAADGTVVAFRDGMADRIHRSDFDSDIANRECGNGVVIDHGAGWQTQYCHLQNGSVIVEKGQVLESGDPIGLVGLSGKTQFPHVHMGVRKNGEVVDPFTPEDRTTCAIDASRSTLWADPLPYEAGGPISAGFATSVPAYELIKEGAAHSTSLSANAPALVIWGFFHNSQENDIVTLSIKGPNGVIFDSDATLEKGQALFFRAGGKKRTTAAWPTGVYTGTAELIRDGQTIGTQINETEIN